MEKLKYLLSTFRFYFSFQDAGYLYMAMDLAPGGELLGLITAKQSEKQDAGIENEACDVYTTQFYIAEIIEAIEYLHSRKIIHRDLKPESKYAQLLQPALSLTAFPLLESPCRCPAQRHGSREVNRFRHVDHRRRAEWQSAQ